MQPTRFSSSADVTTDRPGRFGKQLAAHLGRRIGGEWDDAIGRGWIQLAAGRAELVADETVLRLTVEGDAESLAQLEDVVGRHLVRFGAKDELSVHWTRSNGTAGSSQSTA